MARRPRRVNLPQVQDCPAEDLVIHFPRCFAFIDAALARGGGVLVHCAGGVSRSAAVVAGYLMARRGLSFDQSLAALRASRPWVNPNPGFVAQLREFEAKGADASNWRAWRHVCPPEWLMCTQVVSLDGVTRRSHGGAACRQCIVSIAPPPERELPGALKGLSLGGSGAAPL
jgi:hypothetical protein